MVDTGPALRCSACGMAVLVDTAPDGPAGVLWFLDARGHVLERGTVGEGHLHLTGDGRLGEIPSTVYCPGPVLPAVVTVVDLREDAPLVTASADPVPVVDLREPVPVDLPAGAEQAQRRWA